jgi:hypothetical protein
MSITASNLAYLAPAPNYDDDVFDLADHSRHVIIECSRQNPVPRIHEGSSPDNWGTPTIVDVVSPAE